MKLGVQTRIDLWNEPMLDLLGRAAGISMEAGIGSITDQGRRTLDKECKISTDELPDRLHYAKQRAPFVRTQCRTGTLPAARLAAGLCRARETAIDRVNRAALYTRLRGESGDQSWERARESYSGGFPEFSDFQEGRPVLRVRLELASGNAR